VFAAMMGESVRTFEPAKQHAVTTEQTALVQGLPATRSKTERVDLVVPEDQFASLFQTGLKTAKHSSGQEYAAPTGALLVPKSFADTVEFAYVPTPPTFFRPDPVAPSLSLDHLDLADVVLMLNAARCHRRGWTGRNVRLAMTDSGFGLHPYFERNGYNIRRVTTSTVTTQPTEDLSGHGTGESANALAIAPDCTFVGVKHDDYSALALETALAEKPQIITNSWGWDIDRTSRDQLQTTDPNQYNELVDVERIITTATSDGVVVIFSAGNGHLAFPACMPKVLAVGGVAASADGSLEASDYASSFKSQLYPDRLVPDICGIVGYSGIPPQRGHIMLPVPPESQLDGANMPASMKGRGWGVFSGTSAAAPQVAGIVALMLGANPQLTPQNVRDLLLASAVDITRGKTARGDVAATGPDLATGSGLVDAFIACQRAAALVS
jgi:subtilisin family serine protease